MRNVRITTSTTLSEMLSSVKEGHFFSFRGETVIISVEALSEDKIKRLCEPTGYELKDITKRALRRKRGLFSRK